ncbi:MAG: TonB-dependent receptor [Azoarcus sp.]|nr:TonB-dependent receptor [Azoarcus sp.]
MSAAILSGLFLMGNPIMAGAQEDSSRLEALQKQIEGLQKALDESQRALAAEREARRVEEAPATEGNAVETPPPLASEPTPTPENDSADSAEQALETVVISGRKAQPLEALKDVPVSVSAVAGQELERLGATDVTQVLNRVGNVNFNYGNPRTGSLTLRGITTGSSDQIDPTIGTTLDDVSLAYTPLANGYPFVDIDTVAVTRGPTGTRGGKPSNIGRITFTTKAPTFTPEAGLSITYGEWDTLKTTAVLGGPLVDGVLAWRGTVLREQGNGPWESQFPDLKGRSTYKNVDRTFGRVQFLFTPSNDFKAKLSGEFQPKGSEWVNGLAIRHAQPEFYSDGTPRAAGNIDATFKKYQRDWFNKDPTLFNANRDYYRYPVNVDNNGAIITGSKGVTLNMDWKLKGHTLESISGWRDHWFSAANDEGTPFDITKSGGYITRYSQKSQEFRLTSDKDEAHVVDYVGGLYWLSTDGDSLNRTRWGNDAGAYQASDAHYNVLNASAAGQAMLRDSLNLAYRGTDNFVKNESFSAYGEADWHLSKPLTLTTGARIARERRRNSQEYVLYDPGVGADFSNAFGLGANVLTTPVADAAAADRLAQGYFGQNYGSLSGAEQELLRRAASVRNGTLGQSALYPKKSAKPWEGNVYSWNVALTDKINDDLTVYGTVQYGEKGGIASINSQGVASLVDKERTTGFEAGFRSSLFAKTLTLNADVFINELRDFQTTVYEHDPIGTAANIASGLTGAEAQAYQSVIGNVPKVRVKGVEIDALYTGIKNLSVRLAASYNDARYAADFYLPQPSEVHYGAGTGLGSHFNAKGKTLHNAPKFTTVVGADYNTQVFGDKVFHVSANYKWTGSYYTAAGNSAYNKQDGYGILDLGIGLGRSDGLFDANLVVKNAFNKSYHVEGWDNYTPSTPRWVGVILSARL